MIPRFLAVVAAALLLSPGCSSEAPQSAESSDPALPHVGAAPAPFSGTYRVSGRTVEEGGANARDIAGTVVLVQEGGGYTATFDLETLFPTPDGLTQAQVVGTGDGSVESRGLVGTAETQVILAQVPGVDPNFSFLPRAYGPRLKSSSTARLTDDGSLVIEIVNQGAEGETYRSSQTTLRGTRISAARQ